MNNNYKVSIFCATYNHVRYIEDAVEGFLCQKTDFPFNIFIFDDASSDGTSDIVRHYADAYPDKIFAYIAEENTCDSPVRPELISNLQRKYCTGTYICFCEGDDMWTDCNKLQIQADYLDANEQCSMVCHDYEIENYDYGTSYPWSYYSEDCMVPTEDIILQPYGNLATASLMMRNSVLVQQELFPKQAGSVFDYQFHLNAICHGYVWYLNRKMSKYRYMHHGSWSEEHKNTDAMDKFIKERIEFLKNYDDFTSNRFSEVIQKKIQLLYEKIQSK